jgi:hypothetical protein
MTMTFRSFATGNGRNLRFPGQQPRPKRLKSTKAAGKARAPGALTDAEHLANAFADVSRRINDLARQLNCLGYFDDNDGRPRAA